METEILTKRKGMLEIFKLKKALLIFGTNFKVVTNDRSKWHYCKCAVHFQANMDEIFFIKVVLIQQIVSTTVQNTANIISMCVLEIRQAQSEIYLFIN